MQQATTRPLWLALAVTAWIAGLVLATRAAIGPFHLIVSVNSPMNGASIFALAFVVLMLWRPIVNLEVGEDWDWKQDRWWLCAAAALVTAFIWPSNFVGFVADDYAHIVTVSEATGRTFWEWFTTKPADRFYRPLGMTWYWIEFQWAGYSALRWHIGGAVLNCLNAMLLFVICRRLRLARLWSLFAAAFFGLHGARPEAVTWVAARFDLLASFFVLAALFVLLRYLENPSRVRLVVLIAVSACGMLCKESAYVFPLLVPAIVWLRSEWRGRTAWVAAGASVLSTAALFVWRWFVLGGIGGYHSTSGEPTIYLLKPWLLFKALALRLWAVLCVPLNWTGGLEPWVVQLLAASVLALLALTLVGSSSREARLGVLIALVAALPVYHLLLIAEDLEKSRVIYLSCAGFALFLAATLQTVPRRHAVIAATVIVGFQVVALWHNLEAWKRMADLHARTCDQVAAYSKRSPEGVYVVGMPNVVEGVYMLRTGLPDCVLVRHGVPKRRLLMADNADEAILKQRERPVLQWNSTTRTVDKIR